MNYPDEVRIVGVQHRYLNGGMEEQTLGFNKIIEVDFGVIQNHEAAKFLHAFLFNERKTILYGAYVEDVVLDDPAHYENEWLDGVQVGRRFIGRFIGKHVYKQFTTPATTVETMYLKSKVEITGTADAPEQFETNVEKLLTDETGATYPAFNASTHVFHASIDGARYCESSFALVDKPTVVAGNLRFSIYRDDFGKPAADGKYYADIAIYLQAK